MNFNRKDALRSGVDCQGVGSHGELYVKRYHNDTRHRIIYDALYDSQMGEQGRRLRLFLAEEEYTAAREIEQFGNIKIENWNQQKSVRENLLACAVELVKRL